MRYLGIDFGTKHVGTALSDERGALAFPRASIPNDARLLDTIERMVLAEAVGCIVVGDTRAYSGAHNAVTTSADAFVDVLKKTLSVPVETVFEAGSSREAARYAPGPQRHDDAAAAAVILQRFLDMRPRGVQ